MVYKNNTIFKDGGVFWLYDDERNKQVFASLEDVQEFIDTLENN